MPTSTLTPGEDQEEKLNPGQKDYDRRFNDIARAEEQGTFKDGSSKEAGDGNSAEALRSKEDAGSASSQWANNFKENSQKTKGTFKNTLKKKGPLAAILGVLGIGGFSATLLFSPAMLLVNMKEMLVEKFNDQLPVLDIRSNRVLANKISKNVTTGICKPVSIRCKYQTMSRRQIAKLEKAGIRVIGDKDQPLTKRGRATRLEIDGKSYDAAALRTELRKNPQLRSAFNRAYNPKVAAFSDAVAGKANRLLKITKKNKFETAKTNEDLSKRLRTSVSGDNFALDSDPGIKQSPSADGKGTVYTDAETGQVLDKEALDKRNADFAAFDKETQARKAALSNTSEKVAKTSIKGALTVTALGAGALDSACTGYRTIRAIGFASKYLGMTQLARYAFEFVNTADAIKAGDATPEQVAYLGTILTSTNSQGKSATDSYGYKYAAYGDVSSHPVTGNEGQTMEEANLADEVLRYVNGQLVSDNIMASIINTVSGGGGTTAAADETCKFVKSGWGQAALVGTAIAGAVAAFATAGISLGWGTVAQVGASVSVGVALGLLTPKLVEMASGTLVTGDENGNEAGNAIVSGMGGYNAQVSQARGLGVLTKEDAIAYQELTNETVALYSATERLEASPFDATNKNTFVGSFVTSLFPYVIKNNSLSVTSSLLGSFAAASSTLKNTFSVSATGADEFNQCSDPEYNELKLAADPFCNLRYGISPTLLQKDPEEVLDYMIENEHIDENTGEPQSEALKKFVEYCIDRTDSIGGYSNDGDTSDEALGYECIQGNGGNSDRNSMFRLYLIDKSIVDGMDEENESGNTNSDDASDTPAASLPDGNESELAQSIIDSNNVSDNTGQLKSIANGTRTNVSSDILRVIAGLSESNKFTISSLKRDQALNIGAGTRSLHLIGRAVDISGRSGVNGVTFGYTGHNATVQAFIDSTTSIMPKGCQIGVPNQDYVKITKANAKNSNCYVFIDRGSAAHLHFGISE